MDTASFEQRIEEAKILRHTNVDDALGCIRQVILEASAAQEQNIVIKAHIALGNMLVTMGSYQNAMDVYHQALEHIPNPKSPAFLWHVYNGIAIIHNHTGNLAEAIVNFQKATLYADQAGELKSKGVLLLNLGNTYNRQDRIDDAINQAKNSYEIARSLNDISLTVSSLANLGIFLNSKMKWSEAMIHLDTAQELAEADGLTLFLSTIYSEKGRIHKQLEQLDQAIEYHTNAINITLSLQDKAQSVDAYLARMECYEVLKDTVKAETDLDEAIRIADELGDMGCQKAAYQQSWRYHSKNKNWKSALEAHERFHNYAKHLQDKEACTQLDVLKMQGLQEAHDRVKVISSIGKKLTSELDLEKVLELGYVQINELLDANTFGIGSYLSESEEISYDLFIESNQRVPCRVISLDQKKSLGSWSILNREDVVIQDSQTELINYGININDLIRSDKDNEFPQSILYTPLVVADEVVGVMTVQSLKKNAYCINAIDSFIAMASYVAIALKNAQQAKLIRSQMEQLKLLSEIDELTGVYNRRYFTSEFRRIWEWSNRDKSEIALLMLDADYFKKINDTYGHPAGDACLVHLAAIIKRKLTRSTDLIARYGGEEFIIALVATPREDALRIAESIRQAIGDSPFEHDGKNLSITVSIGVYCISMKQRPSINYDQCVTRADKALYEAKVQGRNKVVEWLEKSDPDCNNISL